MLSSINGHNNIKNLILIEKKKNPIHHHTTEISNKISRINYLGLWVLSTINQGS